MKYFLIILIVAMVVSPLLQFAPSKRQRRVSRMRESAAVGGLFVEFRNLPEIGGVGRGSKSAGGNIIYYGKRLRPPKGKSTRQGAWQYRQGEWWCADRKQGFPASLDQLPAEIMAVSMDDASCGIYWEEVGDEAEVSQIIAALEAWSESL